MPIYIDPNATIDWQFPEDRGKDGAAVLKLGVPSVSERAEIERLLIGDGKDDVVGLAERVCRAVLRGWSWRLADGREVPYAASDGGRATDETLYAMSLKCRSQLMDKGLRICGLNSPGAGADPEDQDGEVTELDQD